MSFLTSDDFTHSQQPLALGNQQLHLSMHGREGTPCPSCDLHLSMLFELETDFKDLEKRCKIPQMTLSPSFSRNSCVCFCFHQAVEILLLACSNSKAESFPLWLRTCWLDSKKGKSKIWLYPVCSFSCPQFPFCNFERFETS